MKKNGYFIQIKYGSGHFHTILLPLYTVDHTISLINREMCAHNCGKREMYYVWKWFDIEFVEHTLVL